MENIMKVRIDSRLIHGQVALSWCNFLPVNRIMVIDDEIINDSLQISLLKMSCPNGIKLSVLKPADAASNLLANKYMADKIFIIVKNPEMLAQLWDFGIHMKEINVGNMSGNQETILIKKDVCVTKEHIEIFKKLSKKGVKITAQTVPNDLEVDLMNLIEKIK